MPDWIDEFVNDTDAIPSPKIFRLWSAITAVSGALERKVWTAGSAGPIFPHLFTVLVAPPATGKTNAINRARNHWAKIGQLKLGPDSVTKPSLVDSFAKALRTEMDGTNIMTFSALNVSSSEFGVFFVHHDTEFLSFINFIYDSPPMYIEERRTAGNTEITRPHMVLLCGTQPDFLSSFMPEEAWGMGFTSRLLFIYSAEMPTRSMFKKNSKGAGRDHTPGLDAIFKIKGEMEWTDEAMDAMERWYSAGCPPIPTHTKLAHYVGRRALHVIKLSMISAASRSCGLLVELYDFERAQEWLLDAEKVMPDVFYAMSQKSDSQILDDLHYYLWQEWATTRRGTREEISNEFIYQYLKERVPSEKIQRIIDVAVNAGMLKQGKYPGVWVPQPLVKAASQTTYQGDEE